MYVCRPIPCRNPCIVLSWHSSSAPMTVANSTPLTLFPISLLVSAVTNPKSLPAFPWRLALAEQMPALSVLSSN